MSHAGTLSFRRTEMATAHLSVVSFRGLGVYPAPDDVSAAMAEFHVAAGNLVALLKQANDKLYAAEGLFTDTVTRISVDGWNANAARLMGQWGPMEDELRHQASLGVLTPEGWAVRAAELAASTDPEVQKMQAAGLISSDYIDPVQPWIDECRAALRSASRLLAEVKSEDLYSWLDDLGDASCDAVELVWRKTLAAARRVVGDVGQGAIDAAKAAADAAAKLAAEAAKTTATAIVLVGGALAAAFFLLSKSGVRVSHGPVQLGKLRRGRLSRGKR